VSTKFNFSTSISTSISTSQREPSTNQTARFDKLNNHDFFRYNSKPNNNKPCIHLLITSLVPPSTASLPSYKMFQQQTARGGGSGFDGSHHQPSTMRPKDPYEGMSQIERF
jgi:hypothetical protein